MVWDGMGWGEMGWNGVMGLDGMVWEERETEREGERLRETYRQIEKETDRYRGR